MERLTVEIDGNEINLQQLLKWANVVATGGEAKFLIGEGLVKVNGEVETRRRRKLNNGDSIAVDGRVTVLLKTRQ